MHIERGRDTARLRSSLLARHLRRRRLLARGGGGAVNNKTTPLALLAASGLGRSTRRANSAE